MNRRAIIFASVAGILLLIGIIFAFSNPFASRETFEANPALDKTVFISSLKGHTDDLNDEQIAVIQTTLYTIVLGSEETEDPYYEGIIRQGTYKRVNREGSVYTVSFIADIPSIKKSWHVEYTSNPERGDGSTPVIISCLEEKDLIYDAFECKDFNDQ